MASCADATLVFPILVGLTFAKRLHSGLPTGSTEGVIFNKSYTPAEHAVERRKLVRDEAGAQALLL